MTTAQIEYHVYLAEPEAGTVAVFRANSHYHRPPMTASDIAWRGWRRHVSPRPCPLSGRFFAPANASADRIAEEVAYLALTEWPRWEGRAWSDLSVAVDPRVTITVTGGLSLTPVAVPLTRTQAAAAEARANAEAELDRLTCLDDETAVRWLDGDRWRLMPAIEALAIAARVPAVGVYTEDGDHLDTLVFGELPPDPTEPPEWDLTAARAAVSRGMGLDDVREAIVASGVSEKDARAWLVNSRPDALWLGRHKHAVVARAVASGFLEWTSPRQDRARITGAGRAAYAMSGGVADGAGVVFDLRAAGLTTQQVAATLGISAHQVERLAGQATLDLLGAALPNGTIACPRPVDDGASIRTPGMVAMPAGVALSSGLADMQDEALEHVASVTVAGDESASSPPVDESEDGGALYSRMIRAYEAARW